MLERYIMKKRKERKVKFDVRLGGMVDTISFPRGTCHLNDR